MDETTNKPDPKPTPSRRSNVDMFLRTVLTLALLTFVWTCFRMFQVIQETSRIEPYSAASLERVPAASTTPREHQRAIRAAFPLPVLSGAKDAEFGEMMIGDTSYFRCEYEVARPPERVLQFYRQKLVRSGWTDVTEEILDQNLRLSNPTQQGIVDLQDETFLRYYDQQKRTQATFTRGEEYASVAVAAGQRSWQTRVGVRYSEGGPDKLAQQFGQSLNPDMKGRARPLEFSQRLGGQDTMRTQIVSSKLSAQKMRDNMVRKYEGEGWKRIPLPESVTIRHGHSACLMREGKMMIVNAIRDPDTKTSRAIVTFMGPG